MVYPKPGLKYRYLYKLPDHVLRKRKRRDRDHSKVYDLLSDEDLFDIKGAGLRKLDDEEAARFDKEKEMNERDAESKNGSNGGGKSGASRAKRVRLMPQLKQAQESKTGKEITEIKEKATTDYGVNGLEERREDVVPVLRIKLEKTRSRKDRKKGTKRGRKRKAYKMKITERADTSDTITVPIVEKPMRDESSKENEIEEGANGSEFLLSPDRRTSTAAVGVVSPLTKKLEKMLAEGGVDVTIDNSPSERMDSGQVKMKLTKLDYVQATWPYMAEEKAKLPMKKPKPKQKKVKRDVFKQPPLLLGPFTISTPSPVIIKKKRKPYKKRAPSNKIRKAKPDKVKRPRRPADELTTTQVLRKVRYTIDKYFAQMPGTGYRCPSMRDRSQTCEIKDPLTGRKVWLCLVCHKEELDENGDVMICCDRCEDWYHLRCIGVPDEKYPENMKWYCKRCMATAIREGTFDPQKFPLYQ